MQKSHSARMAFVLAAGFAAFAAAGILGQAPAPRSTGHIGTTYCSKLAVAAAMPTDFVPGGSVDFQLDANCFAWMEFFYLNWRAAPGQTGVPDPSASPSQFGAPAATRAGIYPTVWESYHSADELFPSTALRLRGVPAARRGVKLLAATSKFLGADVHFGSIQEASGGWLTDRRGNLTYYEVHVDNDEYGYIIGNGLTRARNQVACANGPAGFSLPHGAGTTAATDYACNGKVAKYGMNFGAIETKAAWIELPDPATWPNYKISVAAISLPSGPDRTNVVVGLVGLHIIHKTPSAQQMMWATFEHVANDPVAVASGSPSPAPPARGWTYYRNDCNPSRDLYVRGREHGARNGRAAVAVLRLPQVRDGRDPGADRSRGAVAHDPDDPHPRAGRAHRGGGRPVGPRVGLLVHLRRRALGVTCNGRRDWVSDGRCGTHPRAWRAPPPAGTTRRARRASRRDRTACRAA